MTATLVREQMEVGSPRRRYSKLMGWWYQPSYRWVACFKVITPEGHELQPWMRIREAYAYCRQMGWKWVIK